MEQEATRFYASWKKALRTEVTVNKVQVISVQDHWEKTLYNRLYELHAVSCWRLLEPDCGIDQVLRGSVQLHDLKMLPLHQLKVLTFVFSATPQIYIIQSVIGNYTEHLLNGSLKMELNKSRCLTESHLIYLSLKYTLGFV